ncbi:Proteophosphoglycan ppg4 [Rhodotorula toruloides ATCC 204091]|uniref:Proteophosphoglycan ppg4 n=1 Tax=Rhodotorula toruloides TaxID=5286 RepID=A0A0K3C6G3_RHOTO|nr:Proteophosphoglycan ppg4 [Rhodotorula toruloides ATCC 204091]KAK4335689.1 Proteophosphoglycan ppg4 [Rhodotorula toruloides]PRQ77645.1 Proteophosphoglycan ppg4 [Rhodotorula toruloides]
MPAPRAAPSGRARAAQARKSVVPDPDLYAQSDSDDDDAAPARSASAAAATKKRNSTGIVLKTDTVRGTVTAENGRRRSTRLSAESQDSLEAARGETAMGKARGTRGTGKAAAKGKKRAKPEPDERAGADEQDEQDASSRTGTRGAKGASKRARKDDEPAEEASTSASAASSSQAGGSGAAPARRGFVPRAVTDLATRVNKPPPQYSTVLVDPEGDDPDPFPFTTAPPTPHAAGKAKRSATSKPKDAPRAKVPRTARQPSISDEEDATPPNGNPSQPSTSRTSRKTPPRPDTQTGVYVHETPVQVKNIAMRQGMGPGTPAAGTARKSVRRSSVRGSGKRGSSIGNGYEAVPHPQVADDKLYRSTDADDPIAKRLRSIVSWASQRTRDRVLRSVKEGERDDPAVKAAEEIMDGFIDDVCRLKVDTSVPFREPSQSQDPDSLPPHPQNESNAAKMKELEEAYAAIATEQTLRQSLDPVYQSFFDARTAAHQTASTSYSSLLPPALSASSSKSPPTPATYAASLDLSLPTPTTLDEALALGRRLLQGEGVREDVPAKGKKSAKGKGKEKDVGAGETTQDVLQRRITEAQVDTVALRHLTHRLSSFTRLASSYISHRSSETHTALARHTQQGLLGSTGETEGAKGAGEAGGSGGSGLAAATQATVGAEGAVLDPRDLLRAISATDAR